MYIPFVTSDSLFTQLLQDRIQRTVKLMEQTNSLYKWNVLYSYKEALLYKALLQDSDNGVAESILNMISQATFDEMNVKKTIDTLKLQWGQWLPDPIEWVDGLWGLPTKPLQYAPYTKNIDRCPEKNIPRNRTRNHQKLFPKKCNFRNFKKLSYPRDICKKQVPCGTTTVFQDIGSVIKEMSMFFLSWPTILPNLQKKSVTASVR